MLWDSSRGRALVAAVAMMVAGLTVSSSGSATTPSIVTGDAHPPFTTPVMNYVNSRMGTVTMTVHDLINQQTWYLNADQSRHANSIIKVDIMAAYLYQAQGTHRPISADIRMRLARMIEDSNNDDATYLYKLIGSCQGLMSFNALIPLLHTVPVCPSADFYGWGLTATTASDQVAIMNLFAPGSALLTVGSQNLGLSYLTHISAATTWGVGYARTTGDVIAFKNGWSPLTSMTNWEMNSLGWVRGTNRNYEVAILISGNPSYAYGVATLNNLCHLLYQEMGNVVYRTPVSTTTTTSTSTTTSTTSTTLPV